MRITSNMYYKNIYGDNNALLSKNLFDVNKQIASGLKIQYAKDDVRVFTETMQLDNEITVLGQIKKSTESGYKLSNQSDVILNDFEDSTNRMRTLLLQAANGTNSDVSLDSIAQELRAIEEHFKSLANSSVNGQYLFSGSAVDTKPISDDGIYMGNDVKMNAFTGSRTTQQYNMTGSELFLGENNLVKREVTTNVPQSLNAGTSSSLSTSSTMNEFMGDVNAPNNHYFYVSGVKSDGTAFKKQISMTDANTLNDLLTEIGKAYGNTGVDVVNVSMNSSGEIIIEDKLKGSSKLDFHMVGATDFSGGGAANVTNIDNLDGGLTDYASVVATPGLYVKEFVKSPYSSAAAGIVNIDALLYDRTQFSVSGSTVSSSTPQILKKSHIDSNGNETIAVSDRNSFAKPSTLLSEVADLSQLPNVGSLDGTTFNLDGFDINGIAYSVQIDLATAGSTFTLGANTYDIFNMETPRTAVDADKMTYQQLMDVINMVVTGELPATAPGTDAQYDTAVGDSKLLGDTKLSYDGKIQFKDFSSSTTKATISLYDSSAGDFTALAPVSVMTFNTNNAVTIRDPKTDFFKTLNEIITAVEEHKPYPDSSSGDMRNVGIENAIIMMDDLQDHIFKSHSKVGAQSNALIKSLDRTSILEISSMSLRSSVIDTDLAQASLTLAQLNTNYQAMLSTVGKISQLSLVNYL